MEGHQVDRDMVSRLKAYEEELVAIRAENKYLRNEFHRMKEEYINQYASAEREEEMAANKFLSHISKISTDQGHQYPFPGDFSLTEQNGSNNRSNSSSSVSSSGGTRVPLVQVHNIAHPIAGSVEAQVHMENICSEEQEYRINLLQHKMEKLAMKNLAKPSPVSIQNPPRQKRATSTNTLLRTSSSVTPIVGSGPYQHRRDHSTPILLPFFEDYNTAGFTGNSFKLKGYTTRSASVAGIAPAYSSSITNDAMKITIKSLQFQLAISEKEHEQKLQDLKARIKKLEEENYNLKHRIDYHNEKVEKLSMEKEVLIHAFEHETEMFFNTIPEMPLELLSDEHGNLVSPILGSIGDVKLKPRSKTMEDGMMSYSTCEKDSAASDTVRDANVKAPVPVSGRVLSPVSKNRIYKRWTCLPSLKRSSLLFGKGTSPVPPIDFRHVSVTTSVSTSVSPNVKSGKLARQAKERHV